MATPTTESICDMLFHYGIFDLPLSCRFQASTIANLETESVYPGRKVFEHGQALNKNIGATYLPVSTIMEETAIGEDAGAKVAFSNLYPAVIECFAIIICGYVAGRGNMISQIEAKGLNTFVGTFALPAMIFLSMAKLEFGSVNWLFLLSIFISKTLVFVLVAIVVLLIYQPKDYGKAGLFSIFCTQSNDFALGYPIVAALYSKTHPEFASYLYLVAPISLVFLNPIGFILMEIGKRRVMARENNSGASTESRCNLVFNIFKDILFNPIVFMTALGIFCNYLFDHQLPTIVEGVLKVLGQSFSATALFMLGLSMVGKVQSLRGAGLVTPGILIVVKTLLLPLVTREIISFMKPGINSNETTDLSNYGFLYGTFPTAPSVFVFAAQYDVAIDMVASAMVACTFLSAPLMFISAKMISLSKVDPNDYVRELENFLFYVSLVGIVCTVWVIFVFLASRKWKKIPHFITLCLAFSQFIACLGALMWSVTECNHTWKLYVQFILFAFGTYSTRIWTAILAGTLFLLRLKSIPFVLRMRPYFALIGWGIPGLIVATLILVMQQETDLANKHDPNFHYGSIQAITALLLLWFSFFTTIICLILHKRYERRYAQYESLLNADESDDRSTSSNSPGGSPGMLKRLRSSPEDSGSILDFEQSTSLAIDEDASESDSLFSYKDNLLSQTRSRASGAGISSRRQLTEPQEICIVRDRDDEFQLLRHVVLLLLLCASMIVGCALCMWTLFSKEVNGVYVELVFLDVVLNFGQGFFTAAVFGLDTKRIFVNFGKGFRHVFYGASTVKIPTLDKLDSTSRQTCDQFSNYHMDKCINDIVRDRRWRLRQLAAVFCGNELVDWLIMVGLSHDRTEAVKYGRCLLQGGLIRHIDTLHHFHDQPFFYTFRFNNETVSH